jgi:U3 small nucleolar ribonucleoprotein component
VTASLEDIIRSRIIEERFDDVQRKAIVGDIAPKARVELVRRVQQRFWEALC